MIIHIKDDISRFIAKQYYIASTSFNRHVWVHRWALLDNIIDKQGVKVLF